MTSCFRRKSRNSASATMAVQKVITFIVVLRPSFVAERIGDFVRESLKGDADATACGDAMKSILTGGAYFSPENGGRIGKVENAVLRVERMELPLNGVCDSVRMSKDELLGALDKLASLDEHPFNFELDNNKRTIRLYGSER